MHDDNFTIGIYGIQDINNSTIPTLSHDHSIAVTKNSKLIYHSQLERITRSKHCADMPNLLYKLLKNKGLLNKNSDFIFVDNVAGRSFINNEGNIRFEAPISNNLQNFVEEGKMWLLNRQTKAFALNHELAHLGSCIPFFGAFKHKSLLIHFDGGASLSNFSAWLYSNNNLNLIEANWDLKKVSALFNANALIFGIMQAKPFDLNSVPGKLMGFASYGTYNKKIHSFLEQNNFFADCWASKKPFFSAVKKEFGLDIKHFNQQNSFIKDIAATMQHIFVEETLAVIKRLKLQTDAENLYFSGGSALSIVLNTKIINKNWFSNVFIPPCCNDSGLALGAASFFNWQKYNCTEAINPYANNWGIEDYKVAYNENDIKEVAELIISKKVIGICNGFGEMGPRALGNRSIVCLANSKELAKKVSMQHKKREWYRPVAPIMLEKNTKYFTGKDDIHHLSKYMLLYFSILDTKKNEMRGAVHINGTARIQTIFNRNENPYIFDLLTFLDKNHDIKALINTSFNSRGEPIVHTIIDAKKSAQAMNLDAIVLNGKLEII